MNKEQNKKLMTIAEEVLQNDKCKLYKSPGVIFKSYNGQVSALGVSTLTIGLKATLAVYYSDKPKQEGKAYRQLLLDVIVEMMNEKNKTKYKDSEAFVREVMKNRDADKEKSWKRDLIDCSVALKQVIRTYKLDE